jgi:transposase
MLRSANEWEDVEAVDLTDEQWELLEPLIPRPSRRPDRRGKPWRAAREVLDGVLWVLRTGAPWRDLPGRYPPYQTCQRACLVRVRVRMVLYALFYEKDIPN